MAFRRTGLPAFYRITTWQGAMLALDPGSGLIVSAPASGADDAQAVLACIAENAPGRCLLFAEADPPAPFALAPRVAPSVLTALGVALFQPGERAAFFDPPTRRFLCAAPITPPARFGAVAVSAARVGEYEVFALAAVDPATLAPAMRQCTAAAARLLGEPLRARAVLAFMEQTGSHEAAIVLDAIWPLLPIGELQALGAALIARPRLVERLAALLPEDAWASGALPRLAEWQARREAADAPPARLHIGGELDHLAEAGLHGAFASFGHAVNAYARAAVTPRHDICVIATARNEGIYLLEWLAWHRCLGIGHFFLYSNDNNDGSDELLARLADAGIVTWIANTVGPGRWAQAKAYAHALGVLPDVLDYRWALVIDLDEFFVPNPALFPSAVAFAEWHDMRETDAVAINWIFVGSGRETAWRDAPVSRRFGRLQRETNAHVKSMCRPARFIHSHPHFPITDERRAFVYRGANGELHTWHKAVASQGGLAAAFSDQPDADYACIYHYFYKSAEEFLWKFMRNRGDAPNAPGVSVDPRHPEFFQAFLDQHDSADSVPEQRMAHWGPAFEAELARLLALPSVAAANARVQANFRALMAQAKAAAADRADSEPVRRVLQLAGVQGG